jgi:hypothetical protein
MAFIGADVNRWSTPMQKLNDLSRSLTPVCTDNLNTGIMVMKSTQDGV